MKQKHKVLFPLYLASLCKGPVMLIDQVEPKCIQLVEASPGGHFILANASGKALQFVDADKLYPSTNCGMTPLPRQVARGKLSASSAGAEIVRRELLS